MKTENRFSKRECNCFPCDKLLQKLVARKNNYLCSPQSCVLAMWTLAQVHPNLLTYLRWCQVSWGTWWLLWMACFWRLHSEVCAQAHAGPVLGLPGVRMEV